MSRSILFILMFSVGTGMLAAQTSETAVARLASAVDIRYTQILRPGAVKEFDGKKVRFDALFFNIALSNRDLPEKYADSVRLILCTKTYASACEGVYGNAVLAKSKKAQALELRNGDQVRITATAFRAAKPASTRAVPEPAGPGAAKGIVSEKSKTLNSEEPQEQLILEVESIEVVK